MNAFPSRYNDPNSSSLRVTVDGPETTFNIDLTAD